MLLYKKANNKGADQTAQMRRLVCVCVVRNHPPPPPKTGLCPAEAQFINDCHPQWDGNYN